MFQRIHAFGGLALPSSSVSPLLRRLGFCAYSHVLSHISPIFLSVNGVSHWRPNLSVDAGYLGRGGLPAAADYSG